MHWSEAEYALYMARQGTRTPAASHAAARGVPEAVFQARILRLAAQHGWLCHHTHDSRHNDYRSDSGFPDLVLVREVVILAELKTQTGKATAQQERWLQMLARTRQCEVYLWRPRDWAHIQVRLTHPWEAHPTQATGEPAQYRCPACQQVFPARYGLYGCPCLTTQEALPVPAAPTPRPSRRRRRP